MSPHFYPQLKNKIAFIMLVLNMKISEFLYHLLFLWLLLAVFRHHFTFGSNVQAAKPVDLKINPAEYNSRSTTRHILSTLVHEQVNEKKTHKALSGPNPVGNHCPPSRQ
ncbi:hypothetical protein ACH5RR_020800 [Cinchona calisaya]|uniref:Uncharacterized protein n=1 Tax=Cinchona calisaya TaxID=153742 RepID=A0ABD2ZFG7_9GENT